MRPARKSSADFQRPAPRPASPAAPSAVVSTRSGRATVTPSTSAWNCISQSFAAAPPSTSRLDSLSVASASIASSTSFVLKAIASSAARTRCARLPGVEQEKRTGAVGVLRLAGLPASLAKQRRLLVTGHAADRQLRSEMLGDGAPEVAARFPNIRERLGGDAEQFEEIAIPHAPADVVEHRPGRIGVIGGEGLAIREPINQPGVDRAKHHVAVLRTLAQSLHVLEQPLDLRCREVRIEHEAGARLHQRALLLLLELRTTRRGAAILPHDGAMDRPAGGALPRANRLALIRDADSRGRHLGLGDRLARGVDGDAQDLLGVVLDFPRRWKVLGELPITAAEHAAVGAEDERSRAGGALIECEDSGHGASTGWRAA